MSHDLCAACSPSPSLVSAHGCMIQSARFLLTPCSGASIPPHCCCYVACALQLRAHLGNLRARLFQYICSSLDTDALHNAVAANAAAAEVAEAGSSSRRRHHRRCCHRRHHRHGYRQYTASSLCSTAALNSEDWDCYCNSSTSVSTTAAAGSAGGGWRNLRERFVRVFGSWSSGGCDSRDELSSALMDLSEELMTEVSHGGRNAG